jgi:prephenate dehydrogenase
MINEGNAQAPQIIVVAVPPRFAAGVLAKASLDFPTSVITDVTSVKSNILQQAIAGGADAARLVGGHPMAGREVSGAAAARKDLFDDRLWIVTTSSDSSSQAQLVVQQLAQTCGAIPVLMTVAEHDQAVALVSHTPQILSSALAAQLLAAQEQHIAVAGQGLRDMTRIAASDSTLWVDILSENAGPVAEVMGGVVAELQEVLHALQELAHGNRDHAEILDATLRAGAKGKSRIPGRHGNAEIPFSQVAVLIEDKPGELARLFVAAGDAGINLEDVRIEHVLGKPSGLVELSVRPDVAEALVDALMSKDFDVKSFA